MRRIRTFLPLHTRITFYNSFIQPRVDYCSTVWGNANTSRILKLQKMALRIILEIPLKTPSDPLFKRCKIMKIEDRVKYRTACMVFKALNGDTPHYVTDMFKYSCSVSKRTTRQSTKNNLYVPKRQLVVSRNAFRYFGSIVYNSLDFSTSNLQSIEHFKRNYLRFYHTY